PVGIVKDDAVRIGYKQSAILFHHKISGILAAQIVRDYELVISRQRRSENRVLRYFHSIQQPTVIVIFSWVECAGDAFNSTDGQLSRQDRSSNHRLDDYTVCPSQVAAE